MVVENDLQVLTADVVVVRFALCDGVQQALDMMVHDVGGVQGEAEETNEEEAKLAQKAVGGLLDVAGTATLHVSIRSGGK